MHFPGLSRFFSTQGRSQNVCDLHLLSIDAVFMHIIRLQSNKSVKKIFFLIVFQLVKKSASRLMQENAESSISDILEILEKCLPFIGDLSFSSLWIVLLDKIATLSYGTEMLHLYEKIDQEILSMILKGGKFVYKFVNMYFLSSMMLK